MKILDTNHKMSIIEVNDSFKEIRFRIDNSWLDLPLAPFSKKLHEEFSALRNYVEFDDCYYNIILEDECDDIEETVDFADLYVIELVNVLVENGDAKFKNEHWATTNEAWGMLNLTEIAKRKLLNYESIIRYFNITILGKDGTVAYKLLDD